MQDARLQLVPARAAAEFSRLPGKVRRLMLLCDGRRTLRSLCQAGELAPDETARVVERLLALGVVRATTAAPPAKRRLSEKALAWVRAAEPKPLFSAEEEAFFASPIDHLAQDLFAEDL